MGYLVRVFFGTDPSQWVRFVLLGAALALLYVSAMDFRDEIRGEARATRVELQNYMASNKVWQESTHEERMRLLKKANLRFRRLYNKQGWDYEDIE